MARLPAYDGLGQAGQGRWGRWWRRRGFFLPRLLQARRGGEDTRRARRGEEEDDARAHEEQEEGRERGPHAGAPAAGRRRGRRPPSPLHAVDDWAKARTARRKARQHVDRDIQEKRARRRKSAYWPQVPPPNRT